MRISDWSSDVCSSDLDIHHTRRQNIGHLHEKFEHREAYRFGRLQYHRIARRQSRRDFARHHEQGNIPRYDLGADAQRLAVRSEEHTSELQSLMRISYAVFCLKKKKITSRTTHTNTNISSK